MHDIAETDIFLKTTRAGSGFGGEISGSGKKVRIRPDPDPQHCSCGMQIQYLPHGPIAPLSWPILHLQCTTQNLASL
jgi:hypothetical protein